MLRQITGEIAEKCDFIKDENLAEFQQIITKVLGGYEIKKRETAVVVYDEGHQRAYKMFFIAKKIEGLSKRSLKYYKVEVDHFLLFIQKKVELITTDDIRYYLAIKKSRDCVSDVTLNNIRRCLSSFFGWLSAEGYINKNPVFSIKPIKAKKQVKHAFTSVELERMKEACLGFKNALKRKRDIAIIETFLSTGCRVSELASIQLKDIDFQKKVITVLGKGSKERKVFLNEKAMLRIDEYLKEREKRNIESDYLFIAIDRPWDNLRASAVEAIVREIGRSLGIESYPHKFRRTAATIALNRGMSLVNIQRMLGHESIETTRIYLDLSDDALELQHKKYMS